MPGECFECVLQSGGSWNHKSEHQLGNNPSRAGNLKPFEDDPDPSELNDHEIFRKKLAAA